MMKSISLVLLVSLMLACQGPSQPPPAPTTSTMIREAEPAAAEKVAALADRYWELRMWASPTWASYLGDRRYETEMPHLDPGFESAYRYILMSMAADINTIDTEELAPDDELTLDLLELALERQLGEIEHGFDHFSVDQMSGPQVWLLRLANYHPLHDEAGQTAYLKRLQSYPRVIRGHILMLRQGLEAGKTAPKLLVERVLDQLRGLTRTPIAEHPLLRFELAGEESSTESGEEESNEDEEGKAFREDVRRIIESQVRPAFESYLTFLQREYLPQARESIGISEMPGGAAAYAHKIWYHTTQRWDSAELHQVGLDILNELRAEMMSIAESLGHEGDLKSFNAALREDPDNFYVTREGVLSDAERIKARIDERLPNFFGRLPKTDCEIRALEAYQEKDAPAAYYYSPSEDGSRPGIYYVNTYQPEVRARYNMPALTAHEASPGHHLQIALSQEAEGIPKFRRHGGVTAFIEGWALYAELLADEMGIYEDELDRYGMLTYQAWRAARLVVDTGIHAKGWTREQAITIMKDYVALSEAEIINEVDRYIAMPGQALAYMTGRIEFENLRRTARDRLKGNFDIKAFHDEILRHGAIPLSTLGELVDRWLNEQDRE